MTLAIEQSPAEQLQKTNHIHL